MEELVKLTYIDTNFIEGILTSHATGLKKIISRGFPKPVKVKQIAIGILKCGEEIPSHIHPDMDECYYITKGIGLAYINNNRFPLHTGIFVNIPAQSEHCIRCTFAPLHFIYFCMELVYNK